MLSAQEITRRLERILPTVQKPGRYTGGELNQVVKDWEAIPTRLALIFPDIYDIGMSNLGLAVLYDMVNQRPDALAERAFLPWLDMEAAMRRAEIPLYSLETHHPLAAFDILGFSLPYETLYTNTLNALDLAGIPLRAAERTRDHPLIIAGGHATFNPEPMHAFIDAFVIGEGEEVILEIIDTYQCWKQSGADRKDLLKALSNLWGVYVPTLYEPGYNPDGTIERIERLEETAPMPVLKRIVPVLPPATTRFIVPHIDTVHNRVPIEIMRGCTRGCRFCHAGMINRPVRERSVNEIIDTLQQALQNTGFEEIGLLSLSSSDYTQILELIDAVSTHFAGKNLGISLPSLRIEFIFHRADGCLARLPPGWVHPGAGSSHRKDARDHQQTRQYPATAGDHPRHLCPRLHHDQAVLHDRPSLGDYRRCPGYRRPVQYRLERRSSGDRPARPPERRRQHLCAQAAYALPMGALRHRRADPGQASPAQTGAARPGYQADLVQARRHPAGSLAFTRRSPHGRSGLPGLGERG